MSDGTGRQAMAAQSGTSDNPKSSNQESSKKPKTLGKYAWCRQHKPLWNSDRSPCCMCFPYHPPSERRGHRAVGFVQLPDEPQCHVQTVPAISAVAWLCSCCCGFGITCSVRSCWHGCLPHSDGMRCSMGRFPDYGMSVRVGLSAVQGSDFSLNLQACQSGWHPMTAPYV